MRIVVSGTHASGKSTLISDFRQRHPRFVLLDDPYDSLDEASGADEGAFARQLRISVTRLADSADADVIAERGPLDFLAYLTALQHLGRSDGDLLHRATEIVEDSLADIDLIALLPLDERHPIDVPDDEDPALRDAMDAALLEIADDLAALPDAPRFVTLTGDRSARVGALDASIPT
ncbi:hypothetical protein ACI3KS_18020 [Microbacterium sp. ZW T5_45]|uniref:hypothetical protein n=1 Tax=Microbacterium sp. ZW T5_45 TaxID=3378080 RepID=UPI00385452B3